MAKRLFVVAMFILAPAVLCQHSPIFAQSADDAEIRRLLTEYAQARERGDGSAQAQIYSEDADEWRASTRKTVTGRAAIAKDLAVAPNPSRRFRFEIEGVQFIAPNVALVDAVYFGSAAAPNGHVTYVFLKRDGKWLIRAARALRYPEAQP